MATTTTARSLKDRLKEARQAAGWTQKDVATELGYKSGSVISQWETGARPIAANRVDDVEALVVQMEATAAARDNALPPAPKMPTPPVIPALPPPPSPPATPVTPAAAPTTLAAAPATPAAAPTTLAAAPATPAAAPATPAAAPATPPAAPATPTAAPATPATRKTPATAPARVPLPTMPAPAAGATLPAPAASATVPAPAASVTVPAPAASATNRKDAASTPLVAEAAAEVAAENPPGPPQGPRRRPHVPDTHVVRPTPRLVVVSWNVHELHCVTDNEQEKEPAVRSLLARFISEQMDVLVLQEITQVEGPSRVNRLVSLLNDVDNTTSGSQSRWKALLSDASPANGQLHAFIYHASVTVHAAITTPTLTSTSLFSRSQTMSSAPLTVCFSLPQFQIGAQSCQARFTVTSVHLPFRDSRERTNQRSALFDRFAAILGAFTKPTAPVPLTKKGATDARLVPTYHIITGDFNERPKCPAEFVCIGDEHTETKHTGRGFDFFATTRDTVKSFYSQQRELLLEDQWLEKTATDRSGLSDHYPIVLTLEQRPYCR